MAGQGNKDTNRNVVRPAAPALLQTINVASNEDKGSTVSLLQGAVRVLYWESILADTVSASVIFSDSGNTMTRTKKGQGAGKRKKKVSAVEGLPITGGETVELKITDNSENTISFGKGENNLFINSITPIPTDSQTTSKSYELILTSKEYIDNEKERVRYCGSGQISDQVKDILEKVLKSKKVKEEDIETTQVEYQYIGNNKKPFYVINHLSTKAVSAENQEIGVSAGYFFWETSEGYHFKSIDTLCAGEQKKSILYNETPDSAGMPKGYDIKALTLDVDNRVNVQQKLSQGAYSNRRIEINPFTTEYKVDLIDAYDIEKKLELAGDKLPTPNEEFFKPGADADFSRTTFFFSTVGQLNMGEAEEQIEKSKDENLEKGKIVNQAIMRYNQLFASQITITIPGEFSLHAGDTVYMDIPQIGESENKSCADEVNKEDGGLYIIADLCHYITAKDTYTKLNLIRDSVGRTGSPTKGKTFN
tara:strand:+ start:263 stop:1693 length:1431 start_codon:yes stop_codon:yes gene_type:complete